MKKTLSAVILFLAVCGSLSADKQARVVKVSQKDIIELRCQVRMSTAIVLPANEQILEFTTGDKEFWIVNGAQNFCYVHPAKEGATSNLNLICASGNIYSFVLTEISSEPAHREADYKIFVEPKEESEIGALGSLNPRFIPSEELVQYKKQISSLQEQVALAQSEARRFKEKEVNQYRSKYPTSIRFSYQYRSQEPFQVTAIFHDEEFTYIHCNAREKPAIYEVKDGKPNLVNFQMENGCYIVPKIIDRGYLQVGKKKMEFRRAGA